MWFAAASQWVPKAAAGKIISHTGSEHCAWLREATEKKHVKIKYNTCKLCVSRWQSLSFNYFAICRWHTYVVNSIALIPCVCDHSKEIIVASGILLLSKEVKNLYKWISIRCWIFTMNKKHTQSHNEHNKLENQANHGSNLLKPINLSVSITIHLFAIKSKLSLPDNRVLMI